MSANVEEWLVSLLSSTHSSIQQLLLQSMDSDLPSLEELVLYQLTQVACISLHHQWTKDSEQVSIHVIILKGQLVCVCVCLNNSLIPHPNYFKFLVLVYLTACTLYIRGISGKKFFPVSSSKFLCFKEIFCLFLGSC